MKEQGGIAAGHTLTAQAGAEILADGGTAVDAAIAAMFTACVCEPVLASPAGGGFALVSDGGAPACLDFFVHTPKRANGKRHDGLNAVEADFGGVTQGFHIGPGSVATPGFLPGLFTLHARYGTLPMVRLAEFAVALAKEGVTISPFQAKLATIVEPILVATPEARALNTRDGALLDAGDRIVNPPLSDALDAIAREGVRLAKDGEIAHLMVEAVDGGHLTFEDISAYEPVWREPLTRPMPVQASPTERSGGDDRSAVGQTRKLYTNPAPSAGGGLIAAVLASYQGSDRYDPLAFAKALDAVDRRWRDLGKPQGFDDRMMGGKPASVASRGTTHVSVVDRNGRAVAITVSNGEGNGAIVLGCGFMLNNMLGEDDLLADGPGSWQPDQRLSSMMAPTLVGDDKGGLLALGSGGSNRIRSAMAQVLLRWGAHGEPLEDAIRAPRVHVEEGCLDAEPDGDPEPLQRAFEDHRIWDEPSMFFGGAHGVERRVNADGRISVEGAGDERRDGVFVRV
ncbi:MAG: gamma-glutamyltransferase [Rhizobiales bacterium]|nr:gamma-glutamyltransferase [Hyphomicrobiales bacterium]MBO6699069.1 gamma-glutamyltransferase [Hyphomicrobiales bacterium]MBO6736607.1 gamma-glutamyltransferase [Hyphomicrobiales bacterium]MBO6912319.1 gamma-glutamyltransferase [Hyphomicrobiales bacterium]MBO6956318.1 gamma-glutamyltransferase [Hyphomicrobiales bacterium]